MLEGQKNVFMGTVVSTILDPAYQLRDLLFTPKLIYFCVFFAYEGFRNGVTLTHGGMRKGFMARLYAVLYLLSALTNLSRFPNDLKKFLSIDPSDIKEALLFADPFPPLGLLLIGLSVFMLLFTEWLIRYTSRKQTRRSKKTYRVRSARKIIYWMAALPFAVGVQSLLGLPEWVQVGIFVFFAYFAPFTSPQALKRIFNVPDDNNLRTKTVSSTENVH